MRGEIPDWLIPDTRGNATGFGSNQRMTCPAFQSRLTGARIVLSPDFYDRKEWCARDCRCLVLLMVVLQLLLE